MHSVDHPKGNIMVRLAKKLTLLAAMCVVTLAISGCTTPRMLAEGWFWTSYQGGKHFWTTPLIPVPASWSEKVEDAYWEAERYENVPVLDPVEGENAPFFCIDPPSDDEVMRALPDDVTGGMVFVAETSRNNVRIVVEQIVDRPVCTTATTSARSISTRRFAPVGRFPSRTPIRPRKSSTSTTTT